MKPEDLNPENDPEVRITALLLGELTPEEETELRAVMAQNPELTRLHDRLKVVMGLVKDAVPTTEPLTQSLPEPMTLAEERRAELLAVFKGAAPKPKAKKIIKVSFWQRQKADLLKLAAMLVGLLAVTWVMLPKREDEFKGMLEGSSYPRGFAKLKFSMERLFDSDSDHAATPPPPPASASGVLQTMAYEAPIDASDVANLKAQSEIVAAMSAGKTPYEYDLAKSRTYSPSVITAAPDNIAQTGEAVTFASKMPSSANRTVNTLTVLPEIRQTADRSSSANMSFSASTMSVVPQANLSMPSTSVADSTARFARRSEGEKGNRGEFIPQAQSVGGATVGVPLTASAPRVVAPEDLVDRSAGTRGSQIALPALAAADGEQEVTRKMMADPNGRTAANSFSSFQSDGAIVSGNSLALNDSIAGKPMASPGQSGQGGGRGAAINHWGFQGEPPNGGASQIFNATGYADGKNGDAIFSVNSAGNNGVKLLDGHAAAVSGKQSGNWTITAENDFAALPQRQVTQLGLEDSRKLVEGNKSREMERLARTEPTLTGQAGNNDMFLGGAFKSALAPGQIVGTGGTQPTVATKEYAAMGRTERPVIEAYDVEAKPDGNRAIEAKVKSAAAPAMAGEQSKMLVDNDSFGVVPAEPAAPQPMAGPAPVANQTVNRLVTGGLTIDINGGARSAIGGEMKGLSQLGAAAKGVTLNYYDSPEMPVKPSNGQNLPKIAEPQWKGVLQVQDNNSGALHADVNGDRAKMATLGDAQKDVFFDSPAATPTPAKLPQSKDLKLRLMSEQGVTLADSDEDGTKVMSQKQDGFNLDVVDLTVSQKLDNSGLEMGKNGGSLELSYAVTPPATPSSGPVDASAKGKKQEVSQKVQDAKLLMELRRTAEAEVKLKQALKEDPENKAAHYYMELAQEQKFGDASRKRDYEQRSKIVQAGGIPDRSEDLPVANPYARNDMAKIELPKEPELSVEELKKGVTVTRRLEADKLKELGAGKGTSVNSIRNYAKGLVDGVDGYKAEAKNDAKADAVTSAALAKARKSFENQDFAAADKELGELLKIDPENKQAKEFKEYNADVAAKTRQSVDGIKGASTGSYTRAFKVDPQQFINGLESVTGQTGGGNRGGGGGGAIPRVSMAGNQGGGLGGQAAISGVGRQVLTEQVQDQARQFFAAAGLNQGTNGAQVFFNDRTGALVVRGTEQDLEIAQQALEVLAVKPPEVQVQAKLAEVEQEKLAKLQVPSQHASENPAAWRKAREEYISSILRAKEQVGTPLDNLQKDVDRLSDRRVFLEREVVSLRSKSKTMEKEKSAKELAAWSERVKSTESEIAEVDKQLDARLSKLRKLATNEGGSKALTAGDPIKVFVVEDESLNRVYQVGEDGAIVLPRIGRVQVAGKDLTDTEKMIKATLEASPMRQATVMVEFASSEDVKQSNAKKAQEENAAKKIEKAPPGIPQPEVSTAQNAFSTFSLNVSDVSFKLAAASLEKGLMPEPATVRTEEFINAFNYHDPEPTGNARVAFAWERARYPFAHDRDLVRFAVKTGAVGREPGKPLNIVLLLDNSGSMERADRVQIRRECLRVLGGQLQAQDTVSVVAFARTARLWVDGLAGNKAEELQERVGNLTPEGGTNLEEAMNLAYATAQKHFVPNGVNRVVLLTDGAANLGDVSPDSLKKKVVSYRQQGVALDCFGIGWEGYNDDLLEALSRNGDGRYGFVNSPEAATTEFASQLAGALQVAASDVKVQVEWNPKRVTVFRQLGYAKHQLKKEEFRDNKVDAAEIGAAEAGNALYTVQVNPAGEGPLGVVRVRYRVPNTSDYREYEWTLAYDGASKPMEQSSVPLRLAATASAFSEWLVASPFAGEVTAEGLITQLSGVPEAYPADPRPKQLEWMIRQAKSLSGR